MSAKNVSTLAWGKMFVRATLKVKILHDWKNKNEKNKPPIKLFFSDCKGGWEFKII